MVVSDAFDKHADLVIEECNNRDLNVFRLHTRDFPKTVTINLQVSGSHIQGYIRTLQRELDLARVAIAWYRRPRPAHLSAHLTADITDYVVRQAKETLSTLYAALEGRWVVDPFVLELAELKAVQLARASSCGLKTPQTILTNSAASANQFRVICGGSALTKPAKTAITYVHDGSGHRLAESRKWDTPVPDEQLSVSPALYQNYVEKALELRCIVIGDRVFAASVASQEHPSKPVDVRTIMLEIPYLPHNLPDEVSAGLLRLVHSFGIKFCSADMILTPDGDYVFLELNPNGQWLWLNYPPTGLPLRQAFVDFLESHCD